MIVSRSLLLIVAAVVCFVVALLISLGTFTGNGQAWEIGGFLALALSMLPVG